MQQWREVPADWIYTGNPEDVNAEIRSHMARRNLHHNEVAHILGLKRQAFARRLHGETPWRLSEINKLDDAWYTNIYELTVTEDLVTRTNGDDHP